MKKLTPLALIFCALPLLNACVTTTDKEGQVMFAEALHQRGTNPYIENPVVKDLERRIRAIASAPQNLNRKKFGPRDLEILSNFEDRFNFQEMMKWIELSRSIHSAEKLYKVTGNESGCDIDGDTATFVMEYNEVQTFDWVLSRGECKDGKAHGIGYAVPSDGLNGAEFTGRFDNGMMVEGVFDALTKDGHVAKQIGGVTNGVLTARALSSIIENTGYVSHRYADFNDSGKFDGFGINIWNFTDAMLVRAIGDYNNGQSHGFNANQVKRNWGDGEVWNTWIGEYRNGEANGLVGWTNGTDDLAISEYIGDKRNGVGYEQYEDVTGDYHEFLVGTFLNGKKHGTVRKKLANTFNDAYYVTETYSNGNMTNTSDQAPINMGQIFAIAAGAAVIGVSDISEAAKIQVAGALTADVIGNTGGTNLTSLQSSFAQRAQSVSSGNASNSLSSSSTGGNGINVEDIPITCPETGVTTLIPVPWRTTICRRAAIDFATTYACNKLDQERVTRNCKAACGNSQCLQN